MTRGWKRPERQQGGGGLTLISDRQLRGGSPEGETERTRARRQDSVRLPRGQLGPLATHQTRIVCGSLKKAMAPHSSTLAWKVPWTEEPGGLHSMGREESDTTERLHFHFSLSCIGEGNGNPLQCSCLENPRDRGAWWADVYGVAQNRTRLKQLSSSCGSHYNPR